MDRKLLHSFFGNETSSAENELILNWLDSNQANRDRFDAEREIYNSLIINAQSLVEDKKTAARPIFLRRALKYAATAAAVIALALTIGFQMRANLRNEIMSRTMKLSVPAGQMVNMTLADGTNVWLNSESEIEYPIMFGDQRRVKVKGEALFDVEHNAQSPFIVETYACNLEVLGTKFNVNADEQTNFFSAALLEGSLKVSNKNFPNEHVIMAPDDMANMTFGHLTLAKIADREEYNWPDGLISLSNKSFTQLMSIFEKRYGVDIVIENNDIPQIKFHGKIRISDGINHALYVLQRTSDFNFIKDEHANRIYIR